MGSYQLSQRAVRLQPNTAYAACLKTETTYTTGLKAAYVPYVRSARL